MKTMSNFQILHASNPTAEWWRTAVIYQIYPRSFADGNGDGMGDLVGVTSRLDSLAALGIDAIWFSPFFESPQRDGGYDISNYRKIDPLFGTNDDLDALLAKAKSLGIRIIVDIVPNHTSDQHEWFQAALAAAPGSAERDYYHFVPGRGENGELPPNNWQSIFYGPAWTRTTNPDGSAGDWYLHLFDTSQPDLNWANPAVAAEFDEILRFWLEKGVDGFRVDVAHGMAKRQGYPDARDRDSDGQLIPIDTFAILEEAEERVPYWGQPEVHDFIRRFRRVLDEFEDRAFCAEASMSPLSRLAMWVRPDEYHQSFNFDYMETPFEPVALKSIITRSLEEYGKVGASSTWVLSNHDQVRHATRYGYEGKIPRQGDGIGPDYPQPDAALGLRKARAASAFMLGLPGSAYIYQGEELGLPEHTTLEGKYRQDPTFFRTKGEKVGRDGCRVPLPWEGGVNAANGFSQTGESWLPQPPAYAVLARDRQEGVAGSTLELYKRLLKERRAFGMGSGEFRWAEEFQDKNTLAYVNNGVLVLTNFGPEAVIVPAGEILVTTQHDLTIEGELGMQQTVWIKL